MGSGLQEAPADPTCLCSPLSSVIVGNTHGQLAEIDLRQGSGLGSLIGGWGRIPSGAVEPSFRHQFVWVQILVSKAV